MINFGKTKYLRRRGAALLIVLIVVMFTSIFAFSFISSSDSQLLIVKNLTEQSQVETCARAGLEHARSLIMRPWDAQLTGKTYWQGANSCQLNSGSNFFYDITVAQASSGNTQSCSYEIVSSGYNSKANSRCQFKAQLRLDPVVVLWVGDDWINSINTNVYGDVCVLGDIKGATNIDGDVYATGGIDLANVSGDENHSASAPILPMDIDVTDFSSSYYYGGNTYNVEQISTLKQDGLNLSASPSNPAGIFYCDGNLNLGSGNTINGTIFVRGYCEINGSGNMINSLRNFPAIVVGDNLQFKTEGSSLTASGLVQIANGIEIDPSVDTFTLDITGCLALLNSGLTGVANSATITVRVDPAKSAIQLWSSSSSYENWTNVCGGYFKSIIRD